MMMTTMVLTTSHCTIDERIEVPHRQTRKHGSARPESRPTLTTYGDSGGAVYVRGALNAANCDFADNEAVLKRE